jgi:hypothetical protein
VSGEGMGASLGLGVLWRAEVGNGVGDPWIGNREPRSRTVPEPAEEDREEREDRCEGEQCDKWKQSWEKR